MDLKLKKRRLKMANTFYFWYEGEVYEPLSWSFGGEGTPEPIKKAAELIKSHGYYRKGLS